MEYGRLVTTSLFTVATIIFTFSFWQYFKKSRRQKMKTIMPRIESLEEAGKLKWTCVGRVAKLYIYPVKSCAPTQVKQALAERHGFCNGALRDRSLMLVSDKGKMVTGRQIPRTVLVRPTIVDHLLTLSYPDTPDVTVDLLQVEAASVSTRTNVFGDPVVGLDCGEECAAWLEGVLGRKVRLLYHASLPANRSTDLPDSYKYPLLRDDDQPLYADLLEFLLMTSESISDLQTRVPDVHLEPVNFRPNILVEGTPGPFHEDCWKYVKIGDAVFRNNKPCTRCIFTTVDSQTGQKNPNMEPLRTLKKYRCMDSEDPTNPHFGINLGHDLAGMVREGDQVFVTT